MAAPGGGFSFSSTTKPGGFSFGTPNAAPTATTQPAGGFSLGGAAPSQAGFKLGAPTTTPALGLGGGLLGTAPTTKPAGFSLGGLGGTQTTAAGGLTLGAAKPTGFTLGTPAAKPGLALGGLGGAGATTTSTTGFGLGLNAGKPSGLTLGTTPASTGFSLGGGTSTASTGFGLGGATSAASTGFSLGGATSTASTGFKLAGGLGATAPTGLTLGATASTTASKGLGGVDPASFASSKANNGTGNNTATTSDSKAIKESLMPNEIVTTVESFKEYVKKQKGVREEISRFSSKPLHRVHEETIALKQLLSVVSNGLQRNAVAIHKLKLESGQELKNVELAHRTQEIPPALQIENTQPTEYFQCLVEHFEEQMILCRQQIEQLESYMASIAQPASYTPQELSSIMVKLNETFIALAAQLQSVHESVKAQKDLYLNYRRVYHGDVEDIFGARKRTVQRHRMLGALPTGPVPFDSSSNAAALAMATALQTAQKPAGLAGTTLGGGLSGGLGAGGLGTTLGGGLGTTNPLGVGLGSGLIGTGLGTSLGTTGGFGAGLSTGLGLGTSGFGNTGLGTGLSTQTKLVSAVPNVGTVTPFQAGGTFGSGSLSAGPTLGGGSTGFGLGGAVPNAFGQPASSTVTGRPVQLQKPPSKFRKGAR